ncbi:Cytoplasmic tRNA 2-thiolation protein 2, partial [Lunasporangiospora selenospora]
MDSKFRTALRNTRPLRVTNPENVMLAFSGGPASRSLIHLFDVFHSLPPEVASNKLQPKLYSEIHLCHIDESCLNETQTHQGDANNTSTSSTMEQAEAIAARYGYRLHGIRIEDVYDPEWSDSGCFQALLAQILPYVDHASCSTATRTDDPEHHHHHRRLSQIEKIQKLRGLLGSFTTLTAKELIVQHFRSSLLAQQAKRVNCSYLALGDSATRVAIQIISLTALGRGFSLPHETAAMSLWIKDVKIIRPLKDCLVKE